MMSQSVLGRTTRIKRTAYIFKISWIIWNSLDWKLVLEQIRLIGLMPSEVYQGASKSAINLSGGFLMRRNLMVNEISILTIKYEDGNYRIESWSHRKRYVVNIFMKIMQFDPFAKLVSDRIKITFKSFRIILLIFLLFRRYILKVIYFSYHN